MKNYLSYLRIVIAIFIIFAPVMVIKNHSLYLTLAITAAISDFLDGYIARKYEQITKFGSMLDIVADKFFFATVLVFLSYYHFVPVIFTLLVVTRDILIMIVRFMNKDPLPASAVKLGKLRTFILFVALICYPFSLQIMNNLLLTGILLGLLSLIVSLIDLLKK